jgi:Protein of unknown function (DUF3761)
MHHQSWKPVMLAIAAFSLSAVVPLAVSAQDHPQDHRDQNTQEHHDDHSAMPRDDHHDDNRPDPAAQYRHDHPHASARCHDGFFTSTRDRGHACSKHGGIDVWLAL